MDAKDLAPGLSVRLRDLANAARLNGLVGTLVRRDDNTGRWQVDLGQGHGVKALLPKNLVLESAEEEEEEDQLPGNLIDRLLGSDQGATTQQSDEFDEIDAIAEGIDEDQLPDEVFDEGELEGEQEDMEPHEPEETQEPEPEEDAEPVDEELEVDEEMRESEPEEAEPDEGEPEQGDPDEMQFDEAEPYDEHFDEVEPDEVDPDEALDPPDQDEQEQDGTSTQGQEAFDPEEPPEKPVDVDEEPPDFTKMSVKELKGFLQVRGVRIPAWVTEKSDLLSLVKDSAHLPIRPPEVRKENEEAKKKEEDTTPQQKTAEEEKQPEQTPDSTNKGGGPSPAWQPPGGGGWSYSAPRANVPNMANLGGAFGWPPMWGGCPAPPIYPQPTFQPSWVRPVGAPMFPPRPPYSAPAAAAAPPVRPPWPPQSFEDAVFYRDHRLRAIRIDERVREKLRHFCKKHHFSREVEHGLRMLNELTANSIVSDPNLSAKLEKSADPHETLLAELERRDRATATVMRWLIPAKAQRNPEPRQSASRSRRSRSRRRRRRSTPPRSSPKRSSPKRTERRSPIRRNPPPGRPPTPPRARRRKDKSPSPPPGTFVPAPSSKQGIFRTPTPSPSSPPAAPSTNTVYEQEAPEEAENEVREWLRGLDSGKGALVIYTKAITEEFGGVQALAACILPEHPKGSVIGRIEQSLWEALDVKSLGHRLLLAKGILKLE
eukprot:s2_g22.t1